MFFTYTFSRFRRDFFACVRLCAGGEIFFALYAVAMVEIFFSVNGGELCTWVCDVGTGVYVCYVCAGDVLCACDV